VKIVFMRASADGVCDCSDVYTLGLCICICVCMEGGGGMYLCCS